MTGPFDPFGGPAAGAQGGAPVGPGRLIIDRKPILLPSGREYVFELVEATTVEPPMTYVTHRELCVRPALTCSCQPLSLGDITECPRCLSVVCLRHAGSCALCGRPFCSGCFAPGTWPHQPICKPCAEAMQPRSPIRKLWDWLWE